MSNFPARYAVCTRTQFGRDVRGYFATLDQAESFSLRFFPNVWIEDGEANDNPQSEGSAAQ